MSTPTNTVTVPAHIAARIAARKGDNTQTSAVMGAIVNGDGFPYPRISIRAGRYRLVEDGVETVVGTELDVIIVGANPQVSKIFYSKPYDPNATDMRPTCFSHDGVTPDPQSTHPVSASCVNCPNNVLGSKITPSGAKSKLCSDQRHLAVVPAADPSKVYALTVPVSGMKGLREHFKHLNNFNVYPEEAVTTLGFDDQTSYPKMTFTHKGFVSSGALAKIEKVVASDEVKEVVRVLPIGTVRPALAAPAAPAAVGIAAAAATVAAPVAPPAPAVDEAYEEEVSTTPAANMSELEKAVDGMFE